MVAEEQAYQLSGAAIRMDMTRLNREEEPWALTEALNLNVEVWLNLHTIVMRNDCPLPGDTVINLVKLSRFVVERTLAGDEDISDSALDALININLQISEGAA